MVLGNLIQINAKGPEDVLLYGNPQITYFKEVYKKSTNFAINYSKIPISGGGQVDFNSDIRFSIPLKGDLLGGIYLKIAFADLARTTAFQINGAVPNAANGSGLWPEFTSYVNGIGFNCIDFIKLHINGQLIQTLDSHMIYLINELNNDYNKKRAFYRMTRFYPCNSEEKFIIRSHNVTDVGTELLIPFFFCNKSSQYLPLCALTHSDIQVHIKLKTKEKCLVHSYNVGGNATPGINGTDGNGDALSTVPAQYGIYNEAVNASISSFDVIAEYIYLDENEKNLFLNKELSYLIELYNIGSKEIINNPVSSTNYYIDFNAKHPTKYILWTLQREDTDEANLYDNYGNSFELKYSSGKYIYNWEDHLLADATILLNNAELSEVDAVFLSEVQLYEKFNNCTNSIAYLYSFALNPRKLEPTGTMNLSKILHKTIKLKLVNESKYRTPADVVQNLIFRYYTCYYNILSIKNGLAGLLYQ